MRTIAIVNQKGGCGKTTTAINLAAIFARRGVRTLLVDLDPQSHCAAGLGVPESQIDFGIGEALILPEDKPLAPHDLLWEVSRNLDLAPSTTRLAALEAPGGGLHELPDRDRRLAALLDRFHGRYDLVLIDCPPTIGLLTFNALRAAREAIIPVETGYFSLRGAEKQWKTIQRIIDRLNRPIICHMVPTLYDPASRIARELLQQLQREFSHQLVDVPIREHESLREAASFGQPIIEYAPDSPAHQNFEELADWLEEHAAGAGQVQIDIDRRQLEQSPHQPFNDTPRDGGNGDPGQCVAVSSSPLISSRAAELVQRVRGLHLGESPPAKRVQQEMVRAAESSAAKSYAPTKAGSVHHVIGFGANQTSRGVVFCQPHAIGQEIFVAGEFNGWSPTQDRLLFDQHTKTWQATIPIPPGRYRYRLIIDGVWRPDSYNDRATRAVDGELCSVLEVETWSDSP